MSSEHRPQLEGQYHEHLDEVSPAEKVNQAMDDERVKMRDAVVELSKIATLTIADTYSTEDMGVVFAPGYQEQVVAERIRLTERLGDVARLWGELYDTIGEVQRGVGSLQYLIDPDNN